MKRCIAGVVAAALAVLSTVTRLAAQNQPLGDVARKEEARRKEVKQPSKVITNKDLSAAPDAGVPVASPPAVSEPKAENKADKNADKEKPAEPTKDKTYWAGRKKELEAQLDRDETFADALQTKINSLTADFSARDDPAQRAVIGRDRQKSIAELDRLKKAIQDDKKALTDLDEEARRAGVPPGWLR